MAASRGLYAIPVLRCVETPATAPPFCVSRLPHSTMLIPLILLRKQRQCNYFASAYKSPRAAHQWQ